MTQYYLHRLKLSVDFSKNHQYIEEMIVNKNEQILNIKEIQHLGRIAGNISSNTTKVSNAKYPAVGENGFHSYLYRVSGENGCIAISILGQG